MHQLPAPLAPLGAYRQFIVYRLDPKPEQPGKMNKRPCDPNTGQLMPKGADWQNDPALWTDAATACTMAALLGDQYGVGFLFTEADPFVFIDLDNCLTGDQWSETARTIMQALVGAAIEVSQSGAGLHIIGTASNVPEHGCKNGPLGLEMYHARRFVALTGANAVGSASADITAALPALIDRYFPPNASEGVRPAEWTDGPLPEWDGYPDDADLIAAACKSSGAGSKLGGRASFHDLWACNVPALSATYPDNYGGRDYDASQADAALMSHLAFWTGCDCERMERLARESAMYRDKWDTHNSYLVRTITGAVARCGGVHQRKRKPGPVESTAEPGPAVVTTAQLLDGYQYLTPPAQIDHFQGCTYVQDAHRVFTPKGTLLKPEQFRATYGGVVFALDATNDKTTRDAWEAFTQSQAVRYPIAESVAFRPDLPAGTMVEEEGRQLVNTYTPAKVRRLRGGAEPFIDHLNKLLPDATDAAILLAYMAACVQHGGIKFQWTPLIQGAEGNGKTLLTRCVAYAVGIQYSHFPKADEVGNKFNSWMLRKLFIGIEDVYYPDHRREIIESLKPLITNDLLPIELKGVDQISARVCANFMLNTNHMDAIRKTRNDRRFAIFFTAQQSALDIQRCGMGGDYFPRLYEWLKADGYAIVADYLATYEIPDELNPATQCHRAPITSTTEQAVAHGVGSIEQAILEAIDEGRAGFAGGWVSSIALDKLLEQIRRSHAVPHNRRRAMMQEMGYDWHPALRDGRVNNTISMDGGKPRLYIHADHPDRRLETPAMVTAAYVEAQSGTSAAARAFG